MTLTQPACYQISVGYKAHITGAYSKNGDLHGIAEHEQSQKHTFGKCKF